MWNVGVGSLPPRLAERADVLAAERIERHAVLQSDRHRERDSAEVGEEGGALLRDFDRDLPNSTIGIESDDHVSLVTTNLERMVEGPTFDRETSPAQAGQARAIAYLIQ